jgi:hypothetical protein
VNIKFTAAVTSLILASASVSSIAAVTNKVDDFIGLTAAPATSISATAFIVPLEVLSEQTVSIADLINSFTITKPLSETAAIADALTVNVTKSFASSVTATEVISKIFHSSVDFDMSDADIDPDPVTVVDATAFDLSRALSETLTSSDSISNEPGKVVSGDTVTASDTINKKDVGTSPTETLTATDSDAKSATSTASSSASATDSAAKTVNITESSDVTVDSTISKIFQSSVDFDMSDADVDPDPVSATDSAALEPTKSTTSTLTATDSDAKSVTSTATSSASATDSLVSSFTSNQTEILTAGDSVVTQPTSVQSDPITMADVLNTFTYNKYEPDSVTPSDSITNRNITKAITSSVSTTSTIVKQFTSAVDYDLTDVDVDPDPVTASDSINLFSLTKALASSATPSDSLAKTVTSILTSTATATESIALTLTLGETNQYWDEVFMSDGESGFIHTPRLLTIADYDCLLNGDNSLINSATFPDGCEADSTTYEAHTGTIGAPGLVNEPIMNHGLITYPDTSDAGLVVDFHYPTLTIGAYMANITTIT